MAQEDGHASRNGQTVLTPRARPSLTVQVISRRTSPIFLSPSNAPKPQSRLIVERIVWRSYLASQPSTAWSMRRLSQISMSVGFQVVPVAARALSQAVFRLANLVEEGVHFRVFAPLDADRHRWADVLSLLLRLRGSTRPGAASAGMSRPPSGGR